MQRCLNRQVAPALWPIAFLLLFPIASGLAQSKPAAPPTVVFMTDFGHVDDSVAICKGVMYGVEPNLREIDLTHDVTPFSILEGARFFSGAAPYFPAGTVFVGVVDPGVGSTRKPIVARTRRGQYFVVPDNGLLTMVADQDGIEAAREITNTKWMIGAQLSSTFHGRDIFSPVGAHIAHGEDWTEVGPALDPASLVRLNIAKPVIDARGLSASVIGTDGPYGNLISNVTKEDFVRLGYALGAKVPVTLDGKNYEFPFAKTFSDVPVGEPLFYIDSRGRLALAVNQGNFAQRYAVPVPASLLIPAKAATP
jgi:S-adenosylmethionine hydrolase